MTRPAASVPPLDVAATRVVSTAPRAGGGAPRDTVGHAGPAGAGRVAVGAAEVAAADGDGELGGMLAGLDAEGDPVAPDVGVPRDSGSASPLQPVTATSSASATTRCRVMPPR